MLTKKRNKKAQMQFEITMWILVLVIFVIVLFIPFKGKSMAQGLSSTLCKVPLAFGLSLCEAPEHALALGVEQKDYLTTIISWKVEEENKDFHHFSVFLTREGEEQQSSPQYTVPISSGEDEYSVEVKNLLEGQPYQLLVLAQDKEGKPMEQVKAVFSFVLAPTASLFAEVLEYKISVMHFEMNNEFMRDGITKSFCGHLGDRGDEGGLTSECTDLLVDAYGDGNCDDTELEGFLVPSHSAVAFTCTYADTEESFLFLSILADPAGINSWQTDIAELVTSPAELVVEFREQ